MNKKRFRREFFKYIMFLVGIFLYAFSFNLFYAPYNIVIGGSTGLSLIFREWVGISPSVFVAIISYTLLIFSFIYLGKGTTFKTLIGTILYPIFLEVTSRLVVYFDTNLSAMLLVVIYGGVFIGIANGIMLKTGYTTGGFNVIYQILNKYFGISMGNCILVVNAVILLLGFYVFGIACVLYSIVALYISSVITDKVILGISNKKSFYVITSKPKDVKELIFNDLHHTVTEIDARGGYTNEKKKMLMSVIPTREYFIFRESIREIDKNAFFLITDTYEVVNEGKSTN